MQKLLLDAFAVLEGHAGDRLAVLAAEQEPAFGVLRHADPRAVLGAAGSEHVLNLEAGKHVQHRAGILRDGSGAHRCRAVRRTVDGLDYGQLLAGGCGNCQLPTLAHLARKLLGADAIVDVQFLGHARRRVTEGRVAGCQRDALAFDGGGNRGGHVGRLRGRCG